MRPMVLALVPLTVAITLARPAESNPPATSRDTVIRWNEAALAAIRAEKTPPPVAARNLALVHVAIYDAVVAADRRYDPFYFKADAPAGTDPRAAAAVAAHRALAELYPRRLAEFDRLLDDTLGAVPDGVGKSRGIALGLGVAERVLKWRAKDGQSKSDYTTLLGPGRWRPTPPEYREPLLPGWAVVSCFAIGDPTKFRPPGPPELTSDGYATSYREVRSLGSTASKTRTKDQTEVAFFWEDGAGTATPPGHWNTIAQSVSADRRLTLVENARLFALLNVAMADASIVCWDCKYRFDLWRPVTAIRVLDPDWTPLLTTPPFPSYTSGHSSFSGAAAGALEAFFGTDNVKFSSTSDGLPNVTRSFDSFSAAAREAGMSRIYGGIHWGFDNTDGLACGREVGEHIARTFFRPAAVIREWRGGYLPRE